jgi:hypothetical protein
MRVLDDDRDPRIDDLPVDADTHNDVDLERAGQHRRARVDAENQVTSCDLQVHVDEAAEPVSSEHADGRPKTWWGTAYGRALIE